MTNRGDSLRSNISFEAFFDHSAGLFQLSLSQLLQRCWGTRLCEGIAPRTELPVCEAASLSADLPRGCAGRAEGPHRPHLRRAPRRAAPPPLPLPPRRDRLRGWRRAPPVREHRVAARRPAGGPPAPRRPAPPAPGSAVDAAGRGDASPAAGPAVPSGPPPPRREPVRAVGPPGTLVDVTSPPSLHWSRRSRRAGLRLVRLADWSARGRCVWRWGARLGVPCDPGAVRPQADGERFPLPLRQAASARRAPLRLREPAGCGGRPGPHRAPSWAAASPPAKRGGPSVSSRSDLRHGDRLVCSPSREGPDLCSNGADALRPPISVPNLRAA